MRGFAIVTRRITLSLLMLVVAACGGGEGDSIDTATPVVPGASTVPTAGAPSDTAAPQGATWNLEMVEGQLREAGFTVNRDPTPVNLPYMSVRGIAFDLGRQAMVQIYLYGDAGARGADTDSLDVSRAAPRGAAVNWRAPASLVVDNNLAAIVVTGDEAVRTRIAGALHRRADGDGALR
jgi:hypothetical protein